MSKKKKNIYWAQKCLFYKILYSCSSSNLGTQPSHINKVLIYVFSDRPGFPLNGQLGHRGHLNHHSLTTAFFECQFPKVRAKNENDTVHAGCWNCS